MISQPIDTLELQRYLNQLYPDPPPDAWQVVSWLVAKDVLRSQWFRVAQRDDAARFIVQQAQHYDVYIGLGLRHPHCSAYPGTRGTSQDIYAISGLWIEFDHKGGVHTAQYLPTPEELRAFIRSLPFRFSLLVDSTGGHHGYALFKEPWILDTPVEQEAAALLLQRFQRTIQAQAAEHGWKIDYTADLARVLRPAGTLNHKSGTPRLVTILHEDAIRYNPSELADAPWLATIEDTYTPSVGNGEFPATRLEPIIDGCAWLKHCRNDATTLSEPEWYAMLGIVGRCEDGEQIAHTWSSPYPSYTQGETARKLQHALAAAGPRTCSAIRFHLGADSSCRTCQHWGKIKSPIVLGMPPSSRFIPSQRSHNGAMSAARPGQAAQQALDVAETAKQVAATLLCALPTCADDAKEDAILDALPALAPLDALAWMRLKRHLKAAVPALNLNDLERARKELRRTAAQQSAARAPGSSQAELAATLAEDYAGQFAYDLRRQAWIAYDNGLWKPLETERVTQHIIPFMDDVLQGQYTWYELSGVEHLLRTRLAQTLTLETSGWLPFRNGALHLETMALHSHSPERPFTWQLPHHYDPQATCPKTQAWMHEVVGDAHDQVQVLRAYAKAVVTRRVELQRYMETIGPGGTGKGTYTRLLQALVGLENTVATELKHLEANRFELSSLRGKALLMVTDAERYSGPVNALKAITGQDFVRMEEKFKAQRTEIAPVMVVVSANEPIQSADYTSGLVRRRLSMVFRHRPSTPRDLLTWKDGAWQGELATEIPGVLNWVLALPDAQMEALLQQTTETVPSLQETWVCSLVDTNPLAEWANQALILDARQDAQGKPLAAVNVGRAHKIDRTNDYEHQDTWLYPHYRAWVDDTGGKPLSSRRFTGLLKDLFENQLRLKGVEHRDDNKGSRFYSIRFRTSSDADEPLLITKHPPPVTDGTPTVTEEPRTSDGCDVCDGFLHRLYGHLPTPCTPLSLPQGVGVSREGNCNNPAHTSHTSLVRGASVTAPVPPVTEPLSEGGVTVGAWVLPLSADGVIIPDSEFSPPYLVSKIEQGSDGVLYAQFVETEKYWPLAQCVRAASQVPEPTGVDEVMI
jgi:phage/plasmid-associated DNA primase